MRLSTALAGIVFAFICGIAFGIYHLGSGITARCHLHGSFRAIDGSMLACERMADKRPTFRRKAPTPERTR